MRSFRSSNVSNKVNGLGASSKARQRGGSQVVMQLNWRWRKKVES